MDRDTETLGPAGSPAGDREPIAHGGKTTRREPATPRGPGKRGVDFKFRWRPGHEPDYGEPSAGYQYIRWDYSEAPESEPVQTKGLGGGPEAFPCDRCKTGIMRIVARKKPSEIIKESQVVKLKADADLSVMDTDEIFLLCCPQCDQRVQMPGQHVRRLRQAKLGRPL